MRTLILVQILCVMAVNGWSQFSDCVNALPICDNSSLNYSSSGPGEDDFANPNNDNGCLLFGEHESLWLVIRISQMSPPNASLGFTLSPTDNTDDFDFAVYGPESSCNLLGSPIRCSYANANLANCGFCPETGLGNGAVDLLEGATGNGFVAELVTQPFEVYYIVIDNFTASSTGFDLTWTGDAMLDCNLDCLASSGNYNIEGNSNNQTTNFPSNNSSPANYVLCYNDALTFITEENYTLPIPTAGEDASLLWALYISEPPANPSPADPGFSGVLVDEEFFTETNTAGVASALPNGLFLTNNTLWIVPVTGDDGNTNGDPNGTVSIDANGDGCYDYGEPFSITYLNGLSVFAQNACTYPEIQITGGWPELFGGTYTLSNLQPDYASFSDDTPSFSELITIDNLSHGDPYSFTITDENGCSISYNGLFEFSGPYPDLLVQDTIQLCPLSSAELTANTSFVGQTIEYFWSGPGGFSSNEQNPTVAPALEGSYEVYVEVDGCRSNTYYTYIDLLPAPEIDPIPEQAVCNTNFDLSTIELTGSNLSGATFNYYADAGGLPGNPINPLVVTSGTFWIEAIPTDNALVCNGIQSVSVFLGNISVELNSLTSVSCAGGEDGAINTNVSGGQAPYSFDWSGTNAGIEDPTGLGAGNYSLTVTDALGCIATLDVEVPEPNPLEIATVTLTSASCHADNDGIASVEMEGGTLPYTYSWSNGANTASVTNLIGGVNYSVTIEDANGCRVIQDDIMIAETAPIVIAFSLVPPSCGEANGSIQLDLSGGTEPFEYSWTHDTDLNNDQADNLPSGEYIVQVTDALGCTSAQTIPLSDDGAPVITIDSIGSATCSQPNGFAGISVSGGSGSYLISWSHNPTLQDNIAIELEAGSYTVSAIDENGCQATALIEIPGIDPPVISIIDLQAASCSSASNGSATVEVTGGLEPYTIFWSHDPDHFGASADNLGAGSQAVGVIDGNGCWVTLGFFVPTQNDAVLAIDNMIPATCGQSDGTISVVAEGAVAPITYSWSHDSDLDEATAENIPGGIYTITATDANGCDVVLEVELPIADGPMITSTTTDPGGCITPGGSMTVTVTGGFPPYTYEWFHDPTLDGPVAENIPMGFYTVSVTDANGCSNIHTNAVIYIDPDPMILDTIRVVHTLCNAATGEIYMYTEGGVPPYTYTWIPPVSTDSFAVDLPADTYTIISTDAEGCFAIDTVEVMDVAEIVIEGELDIISTKDENCGQGNGAISIQVDEDLPVFWEDHPEFGDTTDLTDLVAGTYTPIITGPFVCTDFGDITIENIPPPTIQIDSIGEISCSNDSYAALSAFGGDGALTYQWSHDSTITTNFVADLPVGDYSVTVTDEFGCMDSISFSISELLPPEIEVDELIHTDCGESNGFATIFTQGGTGDLTFQWSHNSLLNSDTARYLTPGFYTVTVTDEEECEVTESFEIEASDSVIVALANFTDASCNQSTGSIELSVTGGVAPYSYSWSHDPLLTDPQATDLPSGSYMVIVNDSLSCVDSLFIDIDDADGPMITVDEIVRENCEESVGGITISATGGVGELSYTWSHDPTNDTTTAINLPAGFYTVTVEDEAGCRAVETTEIETSEVPELLLLDVAEAECGENSGSILVLVRDSIEPVMYTWSHDSTLNAPLAENLIAGNYTITVTNSNGCTTSSTFGVPGSTAPILEILTLASQNCLSTFGRAEVAVSDGTPPFDIDWSHDENLDTLIVDSLETGMFAIYTVTLTDSLECTDELTFNFPNLPLNEAFVDSLQASHCGNPDGSIFLQTPGFANYRINCGFLTDSVIVDNFSKQFQQDSIFSNNGDPDFQMVDISNSAADLLFQYRRIDANGFTYDFPLLNGAYQVILGFAETGDIAALESNPMVFDVTIEDALVLDNFDVAATYGYQVAGYQTFTVDVLDGNLEIEFDAVQEGAQVSTIEIVPVDQPALTYAWSHDNTINGSFATNVSAGNYTVTITDESGCERQQTFEIGNLDLEPSLDLDLQLDTCGFGVGSIQVTPSIDPAIIRINCGGETYTNEDGFEYAEDDADNNGTLIETENAIGNTNDAELYQNQRVNPTYDFNLPNGQYEVVLHFAELADISASSQNMFNVDIEDINYLFNFDIAQQTGGLYQAYTQSILVYVTDESLDLSLIRLLGNASIAAIEVYPNPIIAPVYTYSWSHDAGLNSPIATQLTNGDYTVSITDIFGCTTEEAISLPTTPPLIFEVVDQTDAQCGLNNGSATVEVSAGNLVTNGDFSAGNFGFESEYDYTAGATGQGRYAITDNAINGNNNFDPCTDHSSGDGLFMLIDGLAAADNEVWCQQFSVIPGVAYEIEAWATSVHPGNPAELQFFINGNAVGNVNELTSNTCEWQSMEASWVADTSEIEFCIINQNAGGFGNDFGLDDIYFAPETGNNNFTWEHDPNLNSNIATDLAPGTYYVSATDHLGCQYQDSVIIVTENSTEFTIAHLDRPGCDLFNGEAVISGAPLYHINAGGPSFIAELTQTLFTADSLFQGGVEESVPEDILGTENNALFQTFRTGEMTYELPVDEDGTYEVMLHFMEPNQSNREFDIIIEGQVVENNFNIFDEVGYSTALIKRYTVNVTDGMINIELTSNNFNPILSALEIYRAVPLNTTFEWSHNGNINGPIATNLTRGDYSLTITEDNNCVSEINFNLEFPPNPHLFLLGSIEPAACLGVLGNAIVESEGAGGYVYEWSHDESLSGNTAENLVTGTYTITVTDLNNCRDTLDIELIDLTVPEIILDSLNNTICSSDDGSIYVHAEGGGGSYQFSWLHNDSIDVPFATELLPGDYTVFVVDKNGCTSSETYIIEPNGPLLDIASVENTICDSILGQIEVMDIGQPTGMVTYSWSHDPNLNAPIATDLAAGDYWVYVDDENGCSDTLQASVGNIDGPGILDIALYNPDSCEVSTGQAQLVISQGTGMITYDWSHDPTLNNPTASNLAPGDYGVTVTDENGCSNEATFEIFAPETFELSLTNSQFATCGEENGSAIIQVVGGNAPFTYQWEHDNSLDTNMVEGLSSGIYTLTVVDNSLCIDSIDFPIIGIDAPIILADSLAPTYCELENGVIALTVDSNADSLFYSWSHDSLLVENTAANLPAGNYEVTVTDNYQCEVTADFEVDQVTEEFETNENLIFCTGLTYELEGINYSNDTTVCILYSSFAGCDSTHCTTITFTPPPVTNLAGMTCTIEEAGIFTDTLSTALGCDSIVINTIEFIPADTTMLESSTCSSADAGIFVDSFTNQFGCDSTVILTVELLPMDTTFQTAYSCNPSEIGVSTNILTNQFGCDSMIVTDILELPRDTSYLTDYTCDPAEVGITMTMLTNQYGCDSMIVTDILELPKDTSYLVEYSCDPAEVGTTMNMMTNQFGCDSMVVTNILELPKDTIYFREETCNEELLGTFTDSYNNIHGCDSTVVREVMYAEYELNAEASTSNEVDLGDSIRLNVYPEFLPVFIEWFPKDGLSCTDCLSPIAEVTDNLLYTVLLRDENNCETTVNLKVEVDPICDIYIPNAFSPNGDGVNDIFEIYSNQCIREVERLLIFDRWGELVFEAYEYSPETLNFGWDGYFRGKPMNPAVFAWFTEIELTNGERVILKGDLTLVR